MLEMAEWLDRNNFRLERFETEGAIAAASSSRRNLLRFGVEILEELHRPRRVDFRVADPNDLAYQSHELTEVRLSKSANA